MNEIEMVAETRALRHEVRRLEIMNEALIDAGKAVVDERNALRARCERYERVLYPQTHEQSDVLERRGRNPEDPSTTERAEES